MKILKSMGQYFLIILVCIFIFISVLLVCSTLSATVFAPKDAIFWVAGPSYYLIFGYEILLTTCAILFAQSMKNKDTNHYSVRFIKSLKRNAVLLIVALVIFIYAIAIDTTYITDDTLIKKSFFSPGGKKYSYGDVVGIDTGFWGKKPLFGASKGDFYYYIRLKDGTRIQMNNFAGTNEETFENDAYKEIEFIDTKLMENDIAKISNLDYAEFCTLDDVYKERFVRIIQNK